MRPYITIGMICFFIAFFAIGQISGNSSYVKHENSAPIKMKKLRIERLFSATPEKVFAAFTNPADMRVWWTEDTEFDIDLRVGGRYTITREENGVAYRMTGEYLEVAEPNRLKYTCGMPDFSPIADTISIEIQANEGGSKMIFIQEGEGIDAELKELPEATTSASEQGWQMGFDFMEQSWKNN